MECDTQSDSDEEDSSATLSYRLKLRAADTRYITSSEDGNRGDVICDDTEFVTLGGLVVGPKPFGTKGL